MDLVDAVDRPQKVGLSGARRASADVHSAHSAFAAKENGTAGGVFKVGVMACFQSGHCCDGLIQEGFRRLNGAWSRTK
jgi:hypothetical protein